MNAVSYILLGLVAGILSGLIGIGGGTIIVPALVLFFGMSQHLAQGTTLALLVPPIGILAAWQYYRQGYVDLHIAGLICLGFVIGGLHGCEDGNEPFEYGIGKDFRRGPSSDFIEDDICKITGRNSLNLEIISPFVSTGSLYLPLFFYFILIAFLRLRKVVYRYKILIRSIRAWIYQPERTGSVFRIMCEN